MSATCGRKAVIAFLLTLTWVMACNHRVPVSPDGEFCSRSLSSLTMLDDPAGELSLALPASVSATRLGNLPTGTTAWRIEDITVSALAASLPRQAMSALTKMDRLLARFLLEVRQLGSAKLSVRSSGSPGRSFDDHSAMKDAIWDIQLAEPTSHRHLRDLLAESMLQYSMPSIDKTTGGEKSRSVVVKVSVIARDDRLHLVAALAHRADYDDPKESTHHLVSDLGNGSVIANSGAGIKRQCDAQTLMQTPAADIIWVVDESDSMTDNRQDVIANAERLFAKALVSGLDFRMGITGVKPPSALNTAGHFCTAEGFTDGGRFLRSDEGELFSACIDDPPQEERDQEYALTNAYEAVRQRLPRMENDPQRIRSNAKLVLIFLSDEVPQELKVGGRFEELEGFFTTNDCSSTQCNLGTESGLQLDLVVSRMLESLGPGSDGDALVHAIAGTCNNGCQAEVGHGFRELAFATGGQISDVCQDDLGPTLQLIVDSIVVSASPKILSNVPISSTLALSFSGEEIPRIHPSEVIEGGTAGYIYDAARNSVSLVNLALRAGEEVRVTYRRFDDLSEL